jgi:excisionase family DNA binding protein
MAKPSSDQHDTSSVVCWLGFSVPAHRRPERSPAMSNNKLKPGAFESPVTDVPGGAHYLGVTEPTMRRLIRDGVIPVTKVGGKPKSRIRILKADLDRLLESGYVPATSGPLAH